MAGSSALANLSTAEAQRLHGLLGEAVAAAKDATLDQPRTERRLSVKQR